jgi:uncharacterized protein YceH (UPF0502 family)
MDSTIKREHATPSRDPNELMHIIITQLGTLKTAISLIESATLSSLQRSSNAERNVAILKQEVARMRRDLDRHLSM